METPAPEADWLEAAETDDGWLDLEDPNAGKTTAAFRYLVDSCMRGTDRVMACDGQFLVYRPFNREFDKETNPRTKQRFNDFVNAGHYEHVGTYDEVQVYKLLEGSPFLHKKNYVVGADRWRDIRTAANAACERNWSDYHDILGGIASAIKSGPGREGFAKMMWDDILNQIAITIKQMNGPTEREVNEGFTGVRRARGISKGGVVATLDSNKLVKVGF